MAARCSLRTGADVTWVDNATHRLHHCGACFPCDRDIEALHCWQGQPLLLSSDTDCLSVWDTAGLVRTCRVGVYPQDMAIAENTAYICGGADGHLHLLTLPMLEMKTSLPLPGMPERIALHGRTVYVLTLMTEPDVRTQLLAVELDSGQHFSIAEYAGLPGTLRADRDGLWVAVSEQLLHLSLPSAKQDCSIRGFGLIRHIRTCPGGVIAVDPLEERVTYVTALPSVVPLPVTASDFTRLIP